MWVHVEYFHVFKILDVSTHLCGAVFNAIFASHAEFCAACALATICRFVRSFVLNEAPECCFEQPFATTTPRQANTHCLDIVIMSTEKEIQHMFVKCRQTILHFHKQLIWKHPKQKPSMCANFHELWNFVDRPINYHKLSCVIWPLLITRPGLVTIQNYAACRTRCTFI